MVLSACAVYTYTEYEGVVSEDLKINLVTALSVVGAPEGSRAVHIIVYGVCSSVRSGECRGKSQHRRRRVQ